MNFEEASGADFREVQDGSRDGKPTRAVFAAKSYRTTQSKIWGVLSNGERMPRWFLPVSGDLRVGGRYSLEGNASGEILRCDAPDAIEVTWEFGGNLSWLDVHLFPEGDDTRLTLRHEFLKDEGSEEHWMKFGPGATGVGWDLVLHGLSLHISSGGAAISKENHNSWLASDNGKRFMRASATSWCKAHVSAGEAPGIAKEMAQRTFAAYSPE